MKKTTKGSSVFGFLIMFFLILGISKCGKNEKEKSLDNVTVTETVTEVNVDTDIKNSEEPQQDNIEVIYADDDMINLYINKFNYANPNDKITSSMAQKYYHHGQEHDDQIRYMKGDFEVVITGGYSGVKIVIIGKPTSTNEEYKSLFFEYAKGYGSDLNDETLENYWNQIMEEVTNKVEFDEFECDFDIYKDDKIEMMVFDGKLK